MVAHYYSVTVQATSKEESVKSTQIWGFRQSVKCELGVRHKCMNIAEAGGLELGISEFFFFQNQFLGYPY